MRAHKAVSLAELVDRTTQRTALLLLLLSFTLGISAVNHLVNEQAGWYLNIAEKGLAVLVVIIGLFCITPMFIKKYALQQYQSLSIESFINDVAMKSFAFSWGVTFMLIVFMGMFAESYLAKQPLEFLMDTIKAVMTGTFAVSFLIYNKGGSNQDIIDGLPGE